MLCQHCKKNIATHDTLQIIGDKKFESHLCSACYKELFGELNKAGGDILAELFGTVKPNRKTCPVCGTTYADYERSGLLGCASCYDVFKAELLPSIERMQGGATEHVGRGDNNIDEHGLFRKLQSLQQQLESALKDRRYAEAGRLNRKINEITKTLNGGGGNE